MLTESHYQYPYHKLSMDIHCNNICNFTINYHVLLMFNAKLKSQVETKNCLLLGAWFLIKPHYNNYYQ